MTQVQKRHMHDQRGPKIDTWKVYLLVAQILVLVEDV